MDRRQKKTRTAIFHAFSELLKTKQYHQITVGEIIGRADIGRATFYAHFETKDDLLKALCEELFCHIFDAANGSGDQHRHIFECDAPESVFLHLLQHLQRNDHSILRLLASENNELFMRFFMENLKTLIRDQLSTFADQRPPALPESFWVHHISSVFVETIRWWMENGMQEDPETLADYFLLVL